MAIRHEDNGVQEQEDSLIRKHGSMPVKQTVDITTPDRKPTGSGYLYRYRVMAHAGVGCGDKHDITTDIKLVHTRFISNFPCIIERECNIATLGWVQVSMAEVSNLISLSDYEVKERENW